MFSITSPYFSCIVCDWQFMWLYLFGHWILIMSFLYINYYIWYLIVWYPLILIQILIKFSVVCLCYKFLFCSAKLINTSSEFTHYYSSMISSFMMYLFGLHCHIFFFLSLTIASLVTQPESLGTLNLFIEMSSSWLINTLTNYNKLSIWHNKVCSHWSSFTSRLDVGLHAGTDLHSSVNPELESNFLITLIIPSISWMLSNPFHRKCWLRRFWTSSLRIIGVISYRKNVLEWGG